MKSSEVIQPVAISQPIAAEGLKFDIPENATGTGKASVAEGFPAITMQSIEDGGKPPRGQDCNGMFYLSTDQKVYLQNGGIITFNQKVSDLIGGYPQNAILDYLDTSGDYYKVKSLIDDNTYNFVESPEYIDDEKWSLISMGGGSGTGGLQMFDLVMKDHVLSFKKSKGYAPLGSYVYKTGVSGSRYGYPSFYNECVKRFQDPNNTSVVLNNNVTASGVTINNGEYTVTGRNYVITDKTINLNAADTWEIVVSAKTPTTFDKGALFGCINNQDTKTPVALIAANGHSNLYLTSTGSTWDIANDLEGTAVYTTNTHYLFKLEFTGTEYILSYSQDEKPTPETVWTEDNRVTSSKKMFTNMALAIGTHQYSSSGQHPWDNGGIIDLKNTYIKINGEVFWKGAANVLLNQNKQIFYDISNKDEIDAIYNTTGAAWCYGVDTVNERIFTPRNDWFYQSGNAENVGKFNEAGLPNITGQFRHGSGYGWHLSGSMYYINQSSAGYMDRIDGGNDSNYTSIQAGLDASLSSSVYGKSDTVQPASVNMMYYIVVGNTEVESAITDVVDITTSENDTLPKYYNFYSTEDMTTTGAYVNASLGAYLNGSGIYESTYNDLVNKIGQSFCAGTVKEHTDPSITDYDAVVNQENMTFRLPLLNGSEDLPSEDYETFTPVHGKPSTASHNGWYTLSLTTSSANNGWCYLYNETAGIRGYGTYAAATGTFSAFVPCKKGDKVITYFDNVTTVIYARHVYAQGAGSLYFKLGNALQNLDVINGAGVLSELNRKTDPAQAANAAMPSDRYIDLSFGANGAEYTAPDDGFINIIVKGNSTYAMLSFTTVSTNYTVEPTNGYYDSIFVPVSKNTKFKLSLTNSPQVTHFRFIYAQGATND